MLSDFRQTLGGYVQSVNGSPNIFLPPSFRNFCKQCSQSDCHILLVLSFFNSILEVMKKTKDRALINTATFPNNDKCFQD